VRLAREAHVVEPTELVDGRIGLGPTALEKAHADPGPAELEGERHPRGSRSHDAHLGCDRDVLGTVPKVLE
jgi:hypothetical protein